MCRLLFIWIVCLLGVGQTLHSGVTYQDGKFFDSKYTPKMSAQEHLNKGIALFDRQNWKEAYAEFRTVVQAFSTSPYAHEATFYAGACAYHLQDVGMANLFLSNYLDRIQEDSRHFEDAFAFKFRVAEVFRQGGKRHLFDMEKMPKLASGREQALEIYDEVTASLPGTNLAAKAYFSKGLLLRELKDFRSSISSFQSLIAKFPQHELVPSAFLEIGDVYHLQLKKNILDPDLLELARMNARKFQTQFPSAPLVKKVYAKVGEMEEVYATGLFEAGQLFERKKQPRASVVYYYSVLKKFPKTKVARQCHKRLQELGEELAELGLEKKPDYKK